MELEIMFPTVAAALFGFVVWLLATLAFVRTPVDDAESSERKAWWRLVTPLCTGVLVLSVLLGWVLQEPDPADERVTIPLSVLAGLTASVAARALWRAIASAREARRVRLPIATVGVFRCRCIVSAEFHAAATPDAFRAALAHESLHIRGRDPLRILAAQFAADLQWPIPSTRRRLDSWLLALELRRDEEAVAEGTPPLELAEALLLAARQVADPPRTPVAPATMGDARSLSIRVRRLLGEPLQPTPSGSAWMVCATCGAAILASVWLGWAYGETLIGLVPGVGR